MRAYPQHMTRTDAVLYTTGAALGAGAAFGVFVYVFVRLCERQSMRGFGEAE